MIRNRKQSGDILYAHDYNTDTLLPRLRAALEVPGPVTVRSGDATYVGSIELAPPAVLSGFGVFASGHIDFTNTAGDQRDVYLVADITLRSPNLTTGEAAFLIDGLPVAANAAVSSDFYASTYVRFQSLLVEGMDIALV
jgi:hypothetical protein